MDKKRGDGNVKEYKVRFSGEQYPISSDLYGIFLEDINFACDGGLNANVVNNYSFDGVYMDLKTKKEIQDPLRYWVFDGCQAVSSSVHALSENSRYVHISFDGSARVINLGYNGQKKHQGEAAVSPKGAARGMNTTGKTR